MASLNKIIYTLGTCTHDGVPVSTRELANHLGDEENIFRRTQSFLMRYPRYFKKTIQGHIAYYVLSLQGKKYFEKIYDTYDPVLDRLVYRG